MPSPKRHVHDEAWHFHVQKSCYSGLLALAKSHDTFTLQLGLDGRDRTADNWREAPSPAIHNSIIRRNKNYFQAGIREMKLALAS